MRQVQYLSKGTSWLNYPMIKTTMMDTGFTESVLTRDYYSTPVKSPTVVTMQQDDSIIDSNSNTFTYFKRDSLAYQDSQL